MICHTVHMGATSLQYEWANECWCFQSVRMPFCILCSCVDSLQCDGVCACSNSQPLCVTLRAGHTGEASPHCKWVNEFSDVQNAEQFFALSASVWLFLDCGRSCASSYLQHNSINQSIFIPRNNLLRFSNRRRLKSQWTHIYKARK